LKEEYGELELGRNHSKDIFLINTHVMLNLCIRAKSGAIKKIS